MKKIYLAIELEYDDEIMHGESKEDQDWFVNKILIGEEGLLLLHSNEIGDSVGKVRGLRVL
jgi:hypothetical protein